MTLMTIDLLGALCDGKVLSIDPTTGKRIFIDTTGNSKSYMRSFMGYTEQQSDLIIEIFRHKLVHLAQPRPVLEYNNKTVVWQFVHENTPNHLILEDVTPGQKIYIKSDWQINIDQVFTLEITQFMLDIRDSVLRHAGYLDKLETDANLLNNFKKAIEETYTP